MKCPPLIIGSEIFNLTIFIFGSRMFFTTDGHIFERPSSKRHTAFLTHSRYLQLFSTLKQHRYVTFENTAVNPSPRREEVFALTLKIYLKGWRGNRRHVGGANNAQLLSPTGRQWVGGKAQHKRIVFGTRWNTLVTSSHFDFWLENGLFPNFFFFRLCCVSGDSFLDTDRCLLALVWIIMVS